MTRCPRCNAVVEVVGVAYSLSEAPANIYIPLAEAVAEAASRYIAENDDDGIEKAYDEMVEAVSRWMVAEEDSSSTDGAPPSTGQQDVVVRRIGMDGTRG